MMAIPTSKRLSDLGMRLGSGLVMMGLALGTLCYSGQAFLLFWLLAAVLVHWEWQHMVGGQRVLLRCLIGTGTLAVSAVFARQVDADLPLMALLVGAVLLLACANKGKRLWSAAGVLYAGSLVLALCTLRFSSPDIFRHTAILWLFAVVWGTDVMAYFGGRLIGGPKLWRRISPSKTWSGTLVGIFCGALIGSAVVYFVASPVVQVPFLPVLLLGLIIGAAAQAGDLLESGMKRHFGVKDSSALIPGHGGIMDRLDGFVTGAVLAAGIGTFRYGSWMAVNGLFQW